MECPHCKSSDQDNDFLFETEHWKAFLTKEQEYLGRCIVELKSHKGHLSELSSIEWLDFGEKVVKKIENTIKSSFHADMFNWTCLVNNAYKKDEPNPHIHWHVRPRYKD